MVSKGLASVQVEADGAGGFRLAGILRAADVSHLLGQLPISAAQLRVDLSGLEAVDSAGLALLVEWQRRLRDAGGAAEFLQPPAGLKRLAQMGGVDTLLGWTPESEGDS